MSVLVVTDTPLKSGYHLQIPEALLDAHGLDYEFTSVLPFMHDKELKKIKPERWLQETPRIHDLAVRHNKILALGGIAPATVFASDKTMPVTRVRGRGFWADIGKRRKPRYTMCSYSPSTVVKDTDFFRDLAFDIEKMATHDAPIAQPDIEIVEANSMRELNALLKELHGASYCAVDTETTDLNPFNADILAIGFSVVEPDDSGYVVVVSQDMIGKGVERFLRTYKGTFVYHNLKFDIQHIWKKFGRFHHHHVADTMLMNWALDERPFGRYKAHRLKLMARLHFDAPEYDLGMKEWLEEYFREEPDEREWLKFCKTLCEDHPEKARTQWRKNYEEEFGEEPVWRGLKVGRDIEPEDIYEYLDRPKHLMLPPSAARKEEMWEDMLRYMGLDCYYTARLFPLLKQYMDEESPRLYEVAHQKFDIPASYALAQMELTGANVDRRYLKKIRKELVDYLEREMSEIRALVAEHTNHHTIRKEGQEFNPNAHQQVSSLLFNAGDEGGLGLAMPKDVGRYAYKREEGEVTTNSDTLKVLARQVAKKRPAIASLIDKIIEYRQKSKIVGTYVDGLLERVDADGRVRGDNQLHGTATARISCSNPNLQNIPDASHVGYDIRKAYVPTPGWTLLEADYSQLELRVAALFSQDPVLLDVYRQGGDIHQEVAYMLWNKPKDQITKYERYLAKCMNFGVIYGRGWKSIATGPEMDNLVAMSGRSWGQNEIGAYFAKFKEGYGTLFKWMELVKRDSLQQRYVENPLGWRRRFDCILNSERGHIERQSVNTPIQGFAARMTIHALVMLDQKFDPEKQRVLFTVHDSIMAECRKEKKIIRETAELIRDTMENDLPQHAIMSLPPMPGSPHDRGDNLAWNLPFVADVVFGKNWGEAYGEIERTPAVVEDTAAIAA